jgi:hypothetical protein
MFSIRLLVHGDQVTSTWRWDETMFGEEHTLKAVAYDLAGNNATSDSIDVMIWNIRLPRPPG